MGYCLGVLNFVTRHRKQCEGSLMGITDRASFLLNYETDDEPANKRL